MKRLFAILCIVMLPVSLSSPASARNVDSSRVTSPDNLIVPYQRIGAIRLGMGMDEVENILGKPRSWETQGYIGASKAASNASSWSYTDVNLQIFFDSGASPVVTAVRTLVWSRGRRKFGNFYWKDCDPVKVSFQTAKGITVGSSSYDVIRAYGDQFTVTDGVFMESKTLGLYITLTTDHIVWSINIRQPERQ